MVSIGTKVNHVASIDPAITEESSNDDLLSPNFIPVVDLRRFSQPELLYFSAVSSSYDFCGFEEDLILKIDCSSFKESAGSRRQTYYRLRLAPRKSEFQLNSTVSCRSVDSSRLISPSPATVDENSRIVRCLRDLFAAEDRGGDLFSIDNQYEECISKAANINDIVQGVNVDDVVGIRGKRKRSTGTDIGMQISANEYKVKKVIVSSGKKREKNTSKIDDIGALADVDGSNDCEPRKTTFGSNNDAELFDVGNQLITPRSSLVHSNGVLHGGSLSPTLTDRL